MSLRDLLKLPKAAICEIKEVFTKKESTIRKMKEQTRFRNLRESAASAGDKKGTDAVLNPHLNDIVFNPGLRGLPRI